MSNPKVLLSVQGVIGPREIVLELNAQAAPKTVAHFLSLVDSAFYNGTVFHRISPQYTITGGGSSVTGMAKKLTKTVANESANGLKNTLGALAMGRTLCKDSISSEFFINMQDNPKLDRLDDSHSGAGYPVFGRVVQGFEVVQKIAQQQRKKALFMEDRPLHPVVIERMVRLPH